MGVARRLKASRRDITSPTIAVLLNRSPNQVSSALSALLRAGRLVIRPAIGPGRQNVYDIAPELVIPKTFPVTMCPPGYADGYGWGDD